MFLCDGWKDFEVIDTGEGEKLERWGDYVLARPDPQVIWPRGDEKNGAPPRPITPAATGAAAAGNSRKSCRKNG